MAATMKRVIVIGATTLAVVGVAGCESNSRSGRSIVFASEAGTAAEALEDGKTLVATSHTTGNVANDFGAGSSVVADASFTIKKNAEGGVDVTLGGETYSFASTDRLNDFGWAIQEDGNFEGVFSYQGNVDDILDPASPHYSLMWEYFFYDDATETENVGYAIVGTETEPEALDTKANATYSGFAAAHLYDKTDPNTNVILEAGTGGAKGVTPTSSVNMTADFASGTISGQMTGLVEVTRAPGGNIYTPVAGTVMMEEASINGNSYAGQLSSTGGVYSLSDTSTYSGRFYGPSAEETAGVLNIETPDMAGSGAYRAFENP